MKFNIAFTTGEDVPEHTGAAFKKQKEKARRADRNAMIASIIGPVAPRIIEWLSGLIGGKLFDTGPNPTLEERLAAMREGFYSGRERMAEEEAARESSPCSDTP